MHSESYMLKIIVENLVVFARSMLGLCSVYARFILLALHAPLFSPINTSQMIDISFFWQLQNHPSGTPKSTVCNSIGNSNSPVCNSKAYRL